MSIDRLIPTANEKFIELEAAVKNFDHLSRNATQGEVDNLSQRLDSCKKVIREAGRLVPNLYTTSPKPRFMTEMNELSRRAELYIEHGKMRLQIKD